LEAILLCCKPILVGILFFGPHRFAINLRRVTSIVWDTSLVRCDRGHVLDGAPKRCHDWRSYDDPLFPLPLSGKTVKQNTSARVTSLIF